MQLAAAQATIQYLQNLQGKRNQKSTSDPRPSSASVQAARESVQVSYRRFWCISTTNVFLLVRSLMFD